MKKPCVISLAMLLILLSATVCQAGDYESDRHQRVGNQMSCQVNDGTRAHPFKSGNMKVHNLSIKICRDPTRIGNMAFDDFDEGTSGTSTRIGGMILYNFDW